ncbi:MAG: hypothetical protein IIB05_04165, partial [Bacteroidetes bacterium]|nr:hypothetical protein [Bacteroidota bacterium]
AFQELKKGDAVAVVAESAKQPRFTKRIQGRTGIVQEKRGRAIVIKMKDINKEKIYIIDPYPRKLLIDFGLKLNANFITKHLEDVSSQDLD